MANKRSMRSWFSKSESPEVRNEQQGASSRYEVGIAPSTFGHSSISFADALKLVIESADTIGSQDVGCRDRREGQVLEGLLRVHKLMDEDFDENGWRASYRQCRDYQEDHPMNSVDQILDRAFVPPAGYGHQQLSSLGEVLDDRTLQRLYRYSVRSSSRALMTGQAALAQAAQRAGAWSLGSSATDDPRDDMVGWTPLHVAATATHLPGILMLMADLASSVPETADSIRTFSSRTDITLKSFGWGVSRTDYGTWIVPNL